MATPIMRQTSAIGSPPDSGNSSGGAWQCPTCNSSELVKLSLVHAAGISGIKAHSRGRGLALGESGVGVSFSGAEIEGTLQTQLSRIASPPRKKRYRYFVNVWVLGLFVAGWIALSLEETQPGNAAQVHQQFNWFSWLYSGLLAWVLSIYWR